MVSVGRACLNTGLPRRIGCQRWMRAKRSTFENPATASALNSDPLRRDGRRFLPCWPLKDPTHVIFVARDSAVVCHVLYTEGTNARSDKRFKGGCRQRCSCPLEGPLTLKLFATPPDKIIDTASHSSHVREQVRRQRNLWSPRAARHLSPSQKRTVRLSGDWPRTEEVEA